jgi:hypothetical protein
MENIGQIDEGPLCGASPHRQPSGHEQPRLLPPNRLKAGIRATAIPDFSVGGVDANQVAPW